MAHRLPLEIITLIAKYVKEEDSSCLLRCACVCRQWQTAFEPLIYRKLIVLNEDMKLRFTPTMLLHQFQTLTSGPNVARRALVHEVDYIIVLPYKLEDYRSVKLQDYSEENPIRAANNEAFREGVVSLFQILSTWGLNNSPYITLELSTVGREQTLEPGTGKEVEADRWQSVPDGDPSVVRPYRARFPDDDASELANVARINRLVHEQQRISGGALLQIAERCIWLTQLHLNVREWRRPDDLDSIRERRQTIGLGLLKLPRSLKVFHLEGIADEPWSNILPALNVLSDGTDVLTVNLQQFSMNLYELKLEEVAFSFEFMFPLDHACKPTPLTSSFYWPNLQRISITAFPDFLPSGKWLFDYRGTEWLDEFVPNPETAGPEVFDAQWMQEEDVVSRDHMCMESFHRLFISLGYAAHRMPYLQTMEISPARESVPSLFEFFTERSQANLQWSSATGYNPNVQVANAWGFSLDDMECIDDGRNEEYGWHHVECKVKLSWPLPVV